MPSTVSPIELAWIVMCVIAEIVHIWNLIDVVRSRRIAMLALAEVDRRPAAALTRARAAARVLFVNQDFRHESVRVFKQLVFIAVGIVAAMTPPAATPPTLASIVVGSAFILLGFLLLVDSIWDRVTRARVRRRLGMSGQ